MSKCFAAKVVSQSDPMPESMRSEPKTYNSELFFAEQYFSADNVMASESRRTDRYRAVADTQTQKRLQPNSSSPTTTESTELPESRESRAKTIIVSLLDVLS